MIEMKFVGDIVQIGAFRCAPDSDLWAEENFSGSQPSVVFPRTTVTIEHSDAPPILATPNHVMYYNPRQFYRRALHSRRGDICEFYRIRPDVLRTIIEPFDHDVVERQDQVFPFREGPGNSRAYLIQRNLFCYVDKCESPDRLFVEETFLNELVSLLGDSYARHTELKPLSNGRRKNHYELVEASKSWLAEYFAEPINLSSLASVVGCSPFHLCRVFRRFTGMTIHRYVTSLRLKAALERVLETSESLTRVGIGVGFSSHAHFSTAFRKEFGLAPTQVRKQDIFQLLPELGARS